MTSSSRRRLGTDSFERRGKKESCAFLSINVAVMLETDQRPWSQGALALWLLQPTDTVSLEEMAAVFYSVIPFIHSCSYFNETTLST